MADDGVVGRGVYVTDGTVPGTRHVSDLEPLPALVEREGEVFVRVGSEAWFVADGPAGTALYATDGTSVRRMLDLSSLQAPRLAPGLSAGRAVVAVEGGVIHETDGVTLSLRSVALVEPAAPRGTRLEATDLVAVEVLHDTARLTAASLHRAVDGRIRFPGTDVADGTEPWGTDGTIPGMCLVADANAGRDPSEPPALRSAPDGRVWFVAWTYEEGNELWSSDGTAAGTGVHPAIVGRDSGITNRLGVSFDFAPDGALLIGLRDAAGGVERRVYRAGSWSLLTDLAPGAANADSNPVLIGSAGGLLAVAGPDAAQQLIVLTTDGMEAGTRPLVTLPQVIARAFLTLDDAVLVGERTTLNTGNITPYRIVDGTRSALGSPVNGRFGLGREWEVLFLDGGGSSTALIVDSGTRRTVFDFAGQTRLAFAGHVGLAGDFACLGVLDTQSGHDLAIYDLRAKPPSLVRIADVVVGAATGLRVDAFAGNFVVQGLGQIHHVPANGPSTLPGVGTASIHGGVLDTHGDGQLWRSDPATRAARTPIATLPIPIDGVTAVAGDNVWGVTRCDRAFDRSPSWRISQATGLVELVSTGRFDVEDFALSGGRLFHADRELYAIDRPGASASTFGGSCSNTAPRLAVVGAPLLGRVVRLRGTLSSGSIGALALGVSSSISRERRARRSPVAGCTSAAGCR
ncbi:MAG: hypothetical protein IPM29_02490 [Planctomycetes bacterium]|nr:hypothetical protein [Planctomycetota bacterium]